MAITKIRGNTQIQGLTIKNDQIATDAAIETSKLAEGAELLKRDGSVALTGNLNAGSNKIENVAAPVNSSDAATKGFVDSEVAIVQDALDAEILRATGVEEGLDTRVATLEDGLQAETTARQNADIGLDSRLTVAEGDIVSLDGRMDSAEGRLTVLESDLSAEVSRAIAAEGVLRTDFDAEVLARQAGDADLAADLAAEEAARMAADSSLSSDISAEASAREAADLVLQGNISAEASAREAADLVLQGNIDSLEVSLSADISAEASAREAADLVLQGNIDAEVVARQAADTNLQSNINTEASARQAADLVLQGNIDAEASAREAADLVLQGNLDAEEAARIAGDLDLQSQIDALDLSSDALAARMTTAEADIDSLEVRMTSAEGDISNLESGLAQEILDRQAGDSATLSSAQSYTDQKVSDLVNSAPAVLDTLKELADALNDDPNFATTVASQIAAVQAEVDAEELARAAADSALQGEIDAEEIARAAADVTLQNNINAEAAARAAADVTLQNNINAEAAARAAADSALDVRVTSLENYDKETVFVDSVNGVDAVGRGTLLKPFKTINYAYSQIPAVAGATDLEKVTKFVREKMVIELAPGTYEENVQIGFKRARMAIVGNGALIVGSVKCKVLKADFPVASLESFKAQNPAPFTGVSAQMCFELAGEAGGGLEGDATANILTVTGLTSLDFENGGANYNWDSQYGQFYSYFDNVNLIGGFNMIHDNSVATARAPACVVEIESAKVGNGDSATRSYLGFVPFGAATTVPAYGGLTLKAHNSTIASVLGPTLTIGEIDGCRLYDIDRTMGAVVTNGSVSGSTSTSYVGIVNTQFRAFSGAAGSSVYKIGAASANVSYKIDSVSHGTLTVGRTLDIAAGRTVTYTLLDRAAGVLVVPTGNISSVNVQAALEELQGDVDTINTSLATKASISALNQEISDRIAGDNTLQNNINAEASARAAADTTLQNNINSEASTRAAADTTLQNNINAEASARAAADTTLQNNINSEQSARIAADNALDARMTTAESDIVALEGRMDTAESDIAALESSVLYVANVVTRETPSGAVDGVNATFVLANSPLFGSEHVYLNGLLQEPGVGNDYVISGSSIVMNSVPNVNDRIRVSYLKA